MVKAISAVSALLLLLFLALPPWRLPSLAEVPGAQLAPAAPQSHLPPLASPEDEKNSLEAQHRQERAANRERQEELKRDSDRLLQLAKELKAEVDKSSEDILSVNVIRKADEIEKLARSVKAKMKAE